MSEYHEDIEPQSGTMTEKSALNEAALREVTALADSVPVHFDDALSSTTQEQSSYYITRSGLILELSKIGVGIPEPDATRFISVIYDIDGHTVDQRAQVSESDAWYSVWLADYHGLQPILPLTHKPSFIRPRNFEFQSGEIREMVISKYRSHKI